MVDCEELEDHSFVLHCSKQVWYLLPDLAELLLDPFFHHYAEQLECCCLKKKKILQFLL